MANAFIVQGMGGLELKVNHRGSFLGIPYGQEEVVVTYSVDGKVFRRLPVGDDRILGVYPLCGNSVGLESPPGVVRLNLVPKGAKGGEVPACIKYYAINAGQLMTEGGFDAYQASLVPR